MTDIKQLLSEMTLDEKISMLAGQDMWHTVPVPRLGIPSIKVSDGPNGVRGAWRGMGPSSVCLPVGMALGATWNVDLVERLGGLLAEEVKLKGAHVLLAPTVNIHRTPIAGRNFECFSEDPYLSGQMAIAYINGLQRNGVGACIKHFVCNDQEFERMSISAEVAERPLREIYLEPFRLAIRTARPWSVMSAYNKINGVYASENDILLKSVLKEEWGFDGLVVSDWFGTYTPRVPASGLDLEMPGPARWMSAEHVKEALESGRLTTEMLDDKVRRLLRLMQRTGVFEQPKLPPERGQDLARHRQLVREAAQETIVLLSNRQFLPLQPEKLQSIAVIGELARWPNVMGGGSSQVRPHPVVSPLAGIGNRAGDQVEVAYEPGCFVRKSLPVSERGTLTTTGGEPGLDLAIYDNLDFSGEPAYTAVAERIDFRWFNHSVPNVNQDRFCVRLSGLFTPQETGTHTFELTSVGQSRLIVDGDVVLDNWTEEADAESKKTTRLQMDGRQSYDLKVEFRWQGDSRLRSLHLGHRPPHAPDPAAAAVALAERADAVILVAGLTSEWESEGFDRVNMSLPGAQDELIERVAAANPNTVVVLNAGSAVAMPWVDRVAAVVEQWYNSQECGNALADVLFGDVNPSGKLPTTFPKRLQDNPAYINYPGENGQVRYGEGLFVGYRYYDKKDLEPLFPFGHGLSYTSFEYSNLQLGAQEFTAEEGLEVSCQVRNTGPRAGKEIVQLYVRDPHSTLVRPEKELKAFAKVALAPGQAQTVIFYLDREAFWYYDPAQGGWQTEPGEFEILAGASSRDLRLRGTASLVDQPEARGRLHTGMPVRAILADEHGRAVLTRHFGELLSAAESYGVLDQRLDQLARLAPDVLPPAKLAQIDAELAAKE